MKQTKIIATIGPASESPETLEKLYHAGANIARINCSHFDEEEFLQKVNIITELNQNGKTNFSIMLDTKGPEIRTTLMETPLEVKAGDTVIVTIPEFADKFEKRLVSDYPYTIIDEQVGNLIDVDCGLLSLSIQEKNSDHLVCYAHHSYTIKSRRHINLPGITLKFPGLTDIDKYHIQFGIENGIHLVAMSFVRDKSHIQEYRAFLHKINAPKIPVIAKIETLDAVEKVDEIIMEADGIMVARGDLGAQVPMEQLPSVQEMIVKKCLLAGKPVIVATNMLESMIDNPTPTRAELTDVHNAVKQSADATMLSGESAIGKYPVEAVTMMRKIISYTEEITDKSHQHFVRNIGIDENKKEVIRMSLYLADKIDAKAIVVFTHTGFMGKTAAALRPEQPVYAFTFSDATVKNLALHYGVNPVLIKESNNVQHLEVAKNYLLENFILKKGDTIVVLIDGNANQESAPEMKIVTL